MEFSQKLQELRKQKGLTQEELAQSLYVSRTAVSKWESGRGYPGIDSLKAIASFFSVTIDDLLSGNQVLSIAEEDHRQKQMHLRTLVFSLLDCSAIMLLFLPFFGQTSGGDIYGVSLLSLAGIDPYLKLAYLAAVAAMGVWGVLTLVLRSCRRPLMGQLSLLFNGMGVLLFIISPQPYAAAFLFLFLGIKVLLLAKWQ